MIYLAIPAVIGAGALVYLATLPKRYEIRRSLPMKVDRQKVFDKVRDLRSWQEWSPWLLHEPQARLEFSDEPGQVGGWYSWDGKDIGAGKLTHVAHTEPGRIEQRIEFYRPFKMPAATVVWELEEKDGQTEVTWSMEGALPLYLRPMRPLLTRMVAKDYDLGLTLLRGKLDPEAERPVIEFVGERQKEAVSALTIPFKGGIEELVVAMKEGFPRLFAHLEQSGGSMTCHPFGAYHKVNPKTMYFECDIAMPVGEDVPDGDFTRKTLGGGKYFKVTLQGSYDFLEVTWTSAMAHMRMRKIKMDRSRPSLEVYENDPNQVERTNDLMTALYIPIR